MTQVTERGRAFIPYFYVVSNLRLDMGMKKGFRLEEHCEEFWPEK